MQIFEFSILAVQMRVLYAQFPLFGLALLKGYSTTICSALVFILKLVWRPQFGDLVRCTDSAARNEGCGVSAKSFREESPHHNYHAKYVQPALFRVYCPAFHCPKTKGVLQLHQQQTSRQLQLPNLVFWERMKWQE